LSPLAELPKMFLLAVSLLHLSDLTID
jgi:hypothetical protein